MSKNKKKRNKVYTGVDAAITKPIITHVTAANRSAIGQFWFERKKILKPVLITSGIVIFVIILIFQIVGLANGG